MTKLLSAGTLRGGRFWVHAIAVGSNGFRCAASHLDLPPELVREDGQEVIRAIRTPELVIEDDDFESDEEMAIVHAGIDVLARKFAKKWDQWANAPGRIVDVVNETQAAEQRLAQLKAEEAKAKEEAELAADLVIVEQKRLQIEAKTLAQAAQARKQEAEAAEAALERVKERATQEAEELEARIVAAKEAEAEHLAGRAARQREEDERTKTARALADAAIAELAEARAELAKIRKAATEAAQAQTVPPVSQDASVARTGE